MSSLEVLGEKKKNGPELSKHFVTIFQQNEQLKDSQIRVHHVIFYFYLFILTKLYGFIHVTSTLCFFTAAAWSRNQ